MSHGEIKALRRSVWREDRERSFEVPLSERGRLPEVRSPTTARSSNARASRQDEVAAMRIEIARQRRAFQANIQRQKEEAAQKRETRMREAAERNEATRRETRAEQTLRREEREKHAERMREMVTLRVLKVHGALSTTPSERQTAERPPSPPGAAGLEPAPLNRPQSPSPSSPSWATELPFTRSGLSKAWLTSA